MKTGRIYVIRNRVNNLVYVGQTTKTVRQRFLMHMKPSVFKGKGMYKFYQAISEIGKENFFYETLEDNVPAEMLDEKEIEWIEKFDSFKNGYNATPGGKGKLICAEEECRLLDMAMSGAKAEELARAFNVNKVTIFRTLHHLGFYFRVSEEEVLVKSGEGKTYDEIAKELGCCEDTVQRILNKNGIRRHKKWITFRKNFDFEGLKKDYHNQMPMNELCEKYGISKTVFYRIKKDKSWKTRPQIYKHKVRYFD